MKTVMGCFKFKVKVKPYDLSSSPGVGLISYWLHPIQVKILISSPSLEQESVGSD